MTTMPLSEARARFEEIAYEVGRPHERVCITREGGRHVVLIAADDLESIEATLELLTDQATQVHARRTEDEVGRGGALDEPELRE